MSNDTRTAFKFVQPGDVFTVVGCKDVYLRADDHVIQLGEKLAEVDWDCVVAARPASEYERSYSGPEDLISTQHRSAMPGDVCYYSTEFTGGFFAVDKNGDLWSFAGFGRNFEERDMADMVYMLADWEGGSE